MRSPLLPSALLGGLGSPQRHQGERKGLLAGWGSGCGAQRVLQHPKPFWLPLAEGRQWPGCSGAGRMLYGHPLGYPCHKGIPSPWTSQLHECALPIGIPCPTGIPSPRVFLLQGFPLPASLPCSMGIPGSPAGPRGCSEEGLPQLCPQPIPAAL